MSRTVEQAGVGTAYLSDTTAENGDYIVHGVALGAGDVTVGGSGIKKKWPASALEQAADTLQGQPLVTDHENNVAGTIGTVTRADYHDGVGVVYEAEIASHYEDIADDIQAGLLEVSARAYHDPVKELDEDEQTDALVVENVVFDNLSVVSNGASPSNSLQMGGHEALVSGQINDGRSVATLSSSVKRENEAIVVAHLADTFDEGDWVEWDTRNSTEIGTVEGIYQAGDELPNFRGSRGLSPEDGETLYALRMYKQRDGMWHPITGGPIGHYHKSVREHDTPDDVSDEAVELSQSIPAASLQTDAELAEPMIERPTDGEPRVLVHTPLTGELNSDRRETIVETAESELNLDVEATRTEQGILFGPAPNTGAGPMEFVHEHLDVVESAADNTVGIEQKSSLFVAGDTDLTLQPSFVVEHEFSENVQDEIARLMQFVTGVEVMPYYGNNRLYLDTGQQHLSHAALDVAEILVRRMGDEHDVAVMAHSFEAADPADHASNSHHMKDDEEMGPSNTSTVVGENDWVQWYPETGPEELHGKVEDINEYEDETRPDEVVVRMYTQDDEGVWHPTDHVRRFPMDEIEPWGNFPTEDAISDERMNAGIDTEYDVASLPSESRKSEGSGDEGDGDEDLDLSESQEEAIENKVEEHNKEHGDEDGKKVTKTMLKNVYKRGLGAYQDSHRPGTVPSQWAMARVNAFLYLVRNGNPENDNYVQDNDLLPEDHPKYSPDSEESSSSTTRSMAELTGYDTFEGASMDELDAVYDEWREHVTLTESEMEDWMEHPCRHEASLDTNAVIERNYNLLETPKSDWTTDEIEDAKRTISFISRMAVEENEPDDPRDGPNGCPSEWAISLLNWAYNPFDELPDVPDEMTEENMMEDINYEAANGAIWFEAPDPQTVVTTPVQFITGSHGFSVESAEHPPRQGAGHLHILINEDFVEPGEKVPKNETHRHMTKGHTNFELELPPGEHTIRMQAGDSHHRAYDLYDEVDITVIDTGASQQSYYGNDEEEEMMEAMTVDELPVDEDDVFKDQGQAMKRAREIGCNSTHTVEVGGDEMHLPCATTTEYEDMVEDMTAAAGLTDASELAEVAGMDINGIAMFDGNMASIEGFEMQDGQLMVELAMIEHEDGEFMKTGETMMRPLTETEMSADTVLFDHDTDELMAAMHTPTYDGTDADSEWSRPTVAEMMEAYGLAGEYDTYAELPMDLKETVAGHFMVSKTGEMPPETYGELALPVVFPNGDLSLMGLDSAHATAMQVGGVDDDMAMQLKEAANQLAMDEFDQAVAGEELAVATVGDYDAQTVTGQSGQDSDAELHTYHTGIMTDIEYDTYNGTVPDQVDDPVVVARDDLESLADDHERVESVGTEQLESLQDTDEPVVVAESEYEELTELVESVGEMYAEELADYSPFAVEELTERFDPTELREKVEAHDEATLAQGIDTESEPDPKGGSTTDEGEPSVEPTVEEMRSEIASQFRADGLDRQAQKVESGEIGLDELGIDTDELSA